VSALSQALQRDKSKKGGRKEGAWSRKMGRSTGSGSGRLSRKKVDLPGGKRKKKKGDREGWLWAPEDF